MDGGQFTGQGFDLHDQFWGEKPSAASKIILARTTSKYGNVYRAARRRSSRCSAADNRIEYGLDRGNVERASNPTIPYVSKLFNYRIR